MAGACAIAPIARFDADGFPCQVAAAVDFEGPEDRRLVLARPAAQDAWRQAAFDVPAARIGVFIGAEAGRLPLTALIGLTRAAGGGDTFDGSAFTKRALQNAADLAPNRASASAVAGNLAAEIDARGPVQTLSLACASGSAAIGEAVRAIRLGRCDVALAGGVGADVDPLMAAGFGLLGALSERGRSRPFDVHRDGFVVGEGAAMVALSSLPSACRITGVGRSLDAWRLTAPAPDGQGAERAMRCALTQAGLHAVDYVQAHGTSTALNDAVEAQALRRVLSQLPHVSSAKGALGHWIAGAGALGFLCAYEAIASGNLVPTCGLEQPDPDCELPHVIGTGIRAVVRAALVNSFGFGGANCSLVLEGS